MADTKHMYKYNFIIRYLDEMENNNSYHIYTNIKEVTFYGPKGIVAPISNKILKSCEQYTKGKMKLIPFHGEAIEIEDRKRTVIVDTVGTIKDIKQIEEEVIAEMSAYSHEYLSDKVIKAVVETSLKAIQSYFHTLNNS